MPDTLPRQCPLCLGGGGSRLARCGCGRSAGAVNYVRNNGPEMLQPVIDAGPETSEEAALDVKPRLIAPARGGVFLCGLTQAPPS